MVLQHRGGLLSRKTVLSAFLFTSVDHTNGFASNGKCTPPLVTIIGVHIMAEQLFTLFSSNLDLSFDTTYIYLIVLAFGYMLIDKLTSGNLTININSHNSNNGGGIFWGLLIGLVFSVLLLHA